MKNLFNFFSRESKNMKEMDDVSQQFLNILCRNNTVIFEKVPLHQYIEDMENNFGKIFTEELLTEFYNNIELPKRATDGSAGYDFFCPFGFELHKGQSVVIPTGIRAQLSQDSFLMMAPRSGHGFRNHVTIANTIGIIDSDYYSSDNYGNIMIKLIFEGFDRPNEQIIINYSNTKDDYTFNLQSFEYPDKFIFKQSAAFCQGIVLQYGIQGEMRDSGRIRNGGMGSTDK